jgi:hypothetical protein
MSKEATLKSSLSFAFLIFLLVNVACVTLAAKSAFNGSSWSIVGEDTSMGLRWLILAVITLAIIAADRLVHGMFLESGVSPVDTTWSDFLIMIYPFVTTVAFFFMSESSWMLFGFFLALLFVSTVIILKKLLENTGRWLLWVFGTIILAAITAIITSTLYVN